MRKRKTTIIQSMYQRYGGSRLPRIFQKYISEFFRASRILVIFTASFRPKRWVENTLPGIGCESPYSKVSKAPKRAKTESKTFGPKSAEIVNNENSDESDYEEIDNFLSQYQTSSRNGIKIYCKNVWRNKNKFWKLHWMQLFAARTLNFFDSSPDRRGLWNHQPEVFHVHAILETTIITRKILKVEKIRKKTATNATFSIWFYFLVPRIF